MELKSQEKGMPDLVSNVGRAKVVNQPKNVWRDLFLINDLKILFVNASTIWDSLMDLVRSDV